MREAPYDKENGAFYFSLSSLQKILEAYTEEAQNQKLWRENAISLTKRYLKEGLRDRAASRDLSIGVTVPVNGYESKKIYVWIEAVSGYYTASKKWAKETNSDDSIFWNETTTSYYVHGKDNIPFHSIIWPGILVGLGKSPLPTHIVSNEYLTLEKKKLSTSRNWAVWIPDMLERYDPDSIRYFLTINAPENRDADFSWKEFIYSHNSELLGAYGNFIHRTLKFIEKSFDGVIQERKIDCTLQNKVKQLYERVGNCIESTSFKQGLERVFEFVRYSNKYFDEQQPWKQISDDIEACKQTLANCVYLIGNLAHILTPFLPFSSEKVKVMLKISETSWNPILIKPIVLSNVEPLFERIDTGRIVEELERLTSKTV